ncbi:hypothetical protein BHE74_00016991 [Ensete ventricosum]|nr:hypothetical protein BHE74_00016991 [Ensete ventricosum]
MTGLMMAERHVSGAIGLTMVERHVSGTIGLTKAERHVSGTIGLTMVKRHVSGTIGLMMAERHVSGTIRLTMAERHVSGTIGLTMAERHVSGTTRLMVAEKHVSGTIGLTIAERHEITRGYVTHGQQTCISPIASVRAHGSAPWPIACRARGFGGGIPSPKDARSRRDLEAMKSCHDIALAISEEALESIRECYSIPEGYVEGNPSPFPGNLGYDREVVGRGWAQSSFSGHYGFEYVVEEAPDARGKGAPVADPESTQPEVDVTHTGASEKRSAGGSAPNPTTTGRPGKRVKIAVRRHKAHRSEGSSCRADWEREPEVSTGDVSLIYRRPKSMRDFCDMQIREDDEGYYVLQMVDWAPKDSSTTMRARDPYGEPDVPSRDGTRETKVREGPRATSSSKATSGRTGGGQHQVEIGVGESRGHLEEADKELNKLREGLMESQRQLKEQKADRRKADDELLKLMRENESPKAELPVKSISDYKQSRPKDNSVLMETHQEFDDFVPPED